MNQALNQTLSRTIITSGTVFLATFSLYIFGGGAINDFAFTFLVGIITGTYSSIYIASALVLWWHKGQRPHIGAGAQAAGGRRGGSRAEVAASAVTCSLVEITAWHWVGFIACVLVFLALDLGVFHRHAHVVKFKEALVWTAVWFSLAMLFALAPETPARHSRRPSSSSPAT